MTKKLILALCAVFLLALAQSVGQNYSLSFWAGDAELGSLDSRVAWYYAKYKKLPENLEQLREYDAVYHEGRNFDSYKEYNTKLTKISDTKLEISLTTGTTGNFLSVCEVKEEGLVMTRFRNNKQTFCSRYDKDGHFYDPEFPRVPIPDKK